MGEHFQTLRDQGAAILAKVATCLFKILQCGSFSVEWFCAISYTENIYLKSCSANSRKLASYFLAGLRREEFSQCKIINWVDIC